MNSPPNITANLYVYMKVEGNPTITTACNGT